MDNTTLTFIAQTVAILMLLTGLIYGIWQFSKYKDMENL